MVTSGRPMVIFWPANGLNLNNNKRQFLLIKNPLADQKGPLAGQKGLLADQEGPSKGFFIYKNDLIWFFLAGQGFFLAGQGSSLAGQGSFLAGL